MYLKELRINGFKSFANPTKLDLTHGVTAIVGPNGCGKSNIADAIRWVLGEQSAKSLRAGAMQDVIFQGTDSRKPVNMCEVSLVFTDCEKQLGTAYAEVEVTRRVTRDGGGSYFINGKACRLKDIQRLFLDTGVGQVSYSFMLQGQIDQILSSNPAERRTIFEEAAGISRYKAQRREALNKLTHVDANLSRVTDVMEEVGRQIGSLKRQASKAMRYKRIKHRLSHLDLAHSGHRYADLKEKSEESDRKSQVLTEHSQKLRAKLDAAEVGLTTKRSRRSELSAGLQDLQHKVFALRSDKEGAQSKAEFAAVRMDEARERIKEIEKELSNLEEKQSQLRELAIGEAKTKEAQMDLFGNSDEIQKERASDLAMTQQRIGEAEAQLSRDKQALLVKESAVVRIRSNCTTMEVDLKSYQVKHANLSDEIKGLEEEGMILTRDLEEIEQTLVQRRMDKGTAEAKIGERQEQVTALVAEFRELQGRITEQDRRLAAVVAQASVLEGLQAKLEGFSEGAKAVLQGKLDGVISQDDCDVLLKNVKVDAEHARGLETLLGAIAEGVVIRDAKRVGPVAEALSEQQLGRAYLKFTAPGKGRKSETKETHPWVHAADVVSASDERLAPLVGNLVEGCYFVSSLKSFLDWWWENPEFKFQLVATEAGELVDARGWVLAGKTKGKKDSSYLARENEIKKLKQERAITEGKLETMRLQADRLQEKIDAAEKAVDDQRRRVLEVSEEVATLESQRNSMRKSVEQNERLLTQKSSEKERLDTAKEESLQRLEHARSQLEESEGGISEQKSKISGGEELVVEIRRELESKRQGFEDIRFEIAEKKQRLELLERGLKEIEGQTKEVEYQRERRNQELKTLKAQIGLLEEDQLIQGERAGEIEREMKERMTELEKLRTELKAVEAQIETVEQGLSSERESYDKISRELNQVDVLLARENAQLQFLEEEVQREYSIEIASINWMTELWLAGDSLPERMRVEIEEETIEDFNPDEERGEPADADKERMSSTDWTEINDEIKTLRTRLQSIGAVNLVAIEEYKALNERHIFLKTQSEDLWGSKDELLKAIDEINATSQELFENTFEQIRKNFIFTFDQLFGGGNADLKLVDNEDVLESGIEITAQPPGTRLKTLALLSGGQKTMTAVALLFAVYMVKPSPFAVLDELDAPLDDANIGRFCKMLERFTEYSQFVIITHNKRTISVANSIYGVTMQEKGVSRLISMRFDKDSGEAKVAEAVTA